MRTLCATALALATLAALPAAAQSDLAVMNAATQIGTVLAGAAVCGFAYDDDAVTAWIDTIVPADNLEFPSMLSTMVMGTEFNLENLSDTARAAQCHAIGRTAAAHGLME